MPDVTAVLELRQYTLRPGRRDDLIELFDRELVEPQEAAGMRIVGQFRDLDAPDRFVWLRGFPDMAARARSLAAFYGGPAWAAHAGPANATMVDSDDVLLLRPAGTGAGFVLPDERPPAVVAIRPASLVVAVIYPLLAPAERGFSRFFDERMRPSLIDAGVRPLAAFETEPAENTFPGLPVRTGEHVFVWFAEFASGDRHRAARVDDAVMPELSPYLAGAPQRLRLEPTGRSLVGRPSPTPADLTITGDVHDFGFLAGEWRIANRRLVRRGVDAGEWDEFPSDHFGRPLLDGQANMDETAFPTKASRALALRLFDPARRQWSIYWVSSARGVLEPPVVGGFAGDRGEFYGQDVNDGRPVWARFLWDRLGPDAARWEQAFSYDGGPWETNWTMRFTRATRERNEER